MGSQNLVLSPTLKALKKARKFTLRIAAHPLKYRPLFAIIPHPSPPPLHGSGSAILGHSELSELFTTIERVELFSPGIGNPIVLAVIPKMKILFHAMQRAHIPVIYSFPCIPSVNIYWKGKFLQRKSFLQFWSEMEQKVQPSLFKSFKCIPKKYLNLAPRILFNF